MPEKHTFQAPRGTRDFYPEDMAIRRHIENVWREVSINHGFEEIEGPMFEHLDLYTVKSGEGIVSELFSFQREGGETRVRTRMQPYPFADPVRTLIDFSHDTDNCAAWLVLQTR